MIRTILTALREARAIRVFIEGAERGSFWNKEDESHLLTFMTSKTGQRFKARLNNMMFKAATRACILPENGDFMRGIARGCMLTIKGIDQHLPATPEPEEQDFATESAQDSNSELAGLALR